VITSCDHLRMRLAAAALLLRLLHAHGLRFFHTLACLRFRFIFWRDEPNRPLVRLRRHHQFFERIHHLPQLSARIAAKGIVAHLQPLRRQLKLCEPLGKVCMQARRLAKLHKRPHRVDTHLHCLGRGQHVSCLNRAMLGEHQRQRFGIQLLPLLPS
jgi:hypothetical protein